MTTQSDIRWLRKYASSETSTLWDARSRRAFWLRCRSALRSADAFTPLSPTEAAVAVLSVATDVGLAIHEYETDLVSVRAGLDALGRSLAFLGGDTSWVEEGLWPKVLADAARSRALRPELRGLARDVLTTLSVVADRRVARAAELGLRWMELNSPIG